MGRLIMDPNLTRHDDIYEQLAARAEMLGEPELRRFHLRLILLLINQIGDAEQILEAISVAAAPGPYNAVSTPPRASSIAGS
jgi:hypothetical protein